MRPKILNLQKCQNPLPTAIAALSKKKQEQKEVEGRKKNLRALKESNFFAALTRQRTRANNNSSSTEADQSILKVLCKKIMP